MTAKADEDSVEDALNQRLNKSLSGPHPARCVQVALSLPPRNAVGDAGGIGHDCHRQVDAAACRHQRAVADLQVFTAPHAPFNIGNKLPITLTKSGDITNLSP